MDVLANRVAAKVSHQWMEVAWQLKLENGDIQRIEKNRQDVFDRFMAVINKWKETLSRPFTWDTLVAVLKSDSVKETRLASELQREFC